MFLASSLVNFISHSKPEPYSVLMRSNNSETVQSTDGGSLVWLITQIMLHGPFMCWTLTYRISPYRWHKRENSKAILPIHHKLQAKVIYIQVLVLVADKSS